MRLLGEKEDIRKYLKMSTIFKVRLLVELLPSCTIISDVCFMSEANLSLCYELLLLVAPALVGSVRPQNGGDLFVDKLFMSVRVTERGGLLTKRVRVSPTAVLSIDERLLHSAFDLLSICSIRSGSKPRKRKIFERKCFELFCVDSG